MVALGILYAAVQAFVAALQVVVTVGVGVALPSPSPITPSGRVADLSLLHLRFACGVAVDAYHPPIWEELSLVKGRMEGLATLNQTLLKGLPSCWRVFGGRLHLSAFLPLLVFVKNVSLLNPSLEPTCSGGGFTPWITRQGTVKASTPGGAYASLLAKHLDGRLASANSL